MTTNQETTDTSRAVFTAEMIRAIANDANNLTENASGNQRVAFTNICKYADGIVENVRSAYDAVNASENKGRSTHRDITASRFADLYTTSAGLLNIDPKKTPSKATVRNLVTFARHGADEAVREHFLTVVSTTGAFSITFDEYVRYLGRLDHFTPAGNWSKVGKDARALELAERANRRAVREAAKTSRPLAFDFASSYTSTEGGDPIGDKQGLLTWLMVLSTELEAAIAATRKGMSKEQLAEVKADAQTRIIAGAAS